LTKTRKLIRAAALLSLGTAMAATHEAAAHGLRSGRCLDVCHHGARFGPHWRSSDHLALRESSHGSRNPYARTTFVGGPAAALGQIGGPARPSCLTRQSTQDGTVVFVDRCSQSIANPPQASAQAVAPSRQSAQR